ncbi:hypothetical protein DPMN_179789 [Dreissena polymorpha]|uniref:Uncharacterized protein n=1 Tax=Dreissena polymorpha TaxID=45954 RepID=A0A9D4EFQ9_DREPO|nr:hypothetical protein DPMN_179789 [Dreissena polymorpha]
MIVVDRPQHVVLICVPGVLSCVPGVLGCVSGVRSCVPGVLNCVPGVLSCVPGVLSAYQGSSVAYQGSSVAYQESSVAYQGSSVAYQGSSVAYQESSVAYQGPQLRIVNIVNIVDDAYVMTTRSTKGKKRRIYFKQFYNATKEGCFKSISSSSKVISCDPRHHKIHRRYR